MIQTEWWTRSVAKRARKMTVIKRKRESKRVNKSNAVNGFRRLGGAIDNLCRLSEAIAPTRYELVMHGTQTSTS